MPIIRVGTVSHSRASLRDAAGPLVSAIFPKLLLMLANRAAAVAQGRRAPTVPIGADIVSRSIAACVRSTNQSAPPVSRPMSGFVARRRTASTAVMNTGSWMSGPPTSHAMCVPPVRRRSSIAAAMMSVKLLGGLPSGPRARAMAVFNNAPARACLATAGNSVHLTTMAPHAMVAHQGKPVVVCATSMADAASPTGSNEDEVVERASSNIVPPPLPLTLVVATSPASATVSPTRDDDDDDDDDLLKSDHEDEDDDEDEETSDVTSPTPEAPSRPLPPSLPLPPPNQP